MTEQHNPEQPDQGQPPAGDPWQEVGKQFQLLGESLGRAFRATWENEENRRHVQEMRNGLEAMVQEVNQAIRDTATSPQAKQAREEARRAAESVRTASEQTVQQVRPHLVSALRQMNEELQKMINRMESQSGGTPPAGSTPPASEPQEPPDMPTPPTI